MSRANLNRVLRRALDGVFSVRVLLVLGYASLGVLLLRGLGVPDRPRGPGLSAEVRRALEGQTPDTLPVVLFVFNPADCPICLQLGRQLNPLHLSGAARVRGLVVNRPSGDAGRGRPGGALGFRYPVQALVRPELLGELVRAGHDTTPIVLLADARHRVTLIVPPLRDRRTHPGAIRLLERQLRHIAETRAKRAAREPARGTSGPGTRHTLLTRLGRSIR